VFNDIGNYEQSTLAALISPAEWNPETEPTKLSPSLV